jgi:hypothetical protein
MMSLSLSGLLDTVKAQLPETRKSPAAGFRSRAVSG